MRISKCLCSIDGFNTMSYVESLRAFLISSWIVRFALFGLLGSTSVHAVSADADSRFSSITASKSCYPLLYPKASKYSYPCYSFLTPQFSKFYQPSTWNFFELVIPFIYLFIYSFIYWAWVETMCQL